MRFLYIVTFIAPVLATDNLLLAEEDARAHIENRGYHSRDYLANRDCNASDENLRLKREIV